MKNCRKINLSLLKLILASGIACISSFLLCKVVLAWLPVPDKTPWNPPRVAFYFSTALPLPNNAFKSRVRSAALEWTIVPNSNFSYVETSSPNSLVLNQGVITYEPLGTVNGATSYIQFATPPNPNPSRFKTAFNSQRNWYTSTGTPSNTQYDFLSTATHELGHALLLFHPYLPDDVPHPPECPDKKITQDTSIHQTMCPVGKAGEIYKRTLEIDDKAGITSLY